MEKSSSLDSFCGSQFWNQSLTWDTTDPDLTRCFEKTVLIWIPCFFLWIFCIIERYYISTSKNSNIPWNWLNLSKIIITTIILILTAVELVFSFRLTVVYNVEIYSPLLKLLSFILSGILVYSNRKHGQRTSGLLFLFWMLLAVCGLFQFRTEIREGQQNRILDDYWIHHVIYLIYYPLVILMFLLNCIADMAPKETKYPISQNSCPHGSASFISRMFFVWVDGLIMKGFRSPLEAKDMWDLNPEDSSREVVAKFEKYWESTLTKRRKKNKQVNILPDILQTIAPTFMFAVMIYVIQTVLIFVNPQILSLIISHVRNVNEGDVEVWKGYFYAVLLFLVGATQTVLTAQHYSRLAIVALRMRSVLFSAIYKKALRISNMARKENTMGEIVNFMTVDAEKIADLIGFVNTLWSTPVKVILAVYFLWQELGPSILAGLAVMIVMIPVTSFIVKKLQVLQIKQMKNKDERVKLMNEILNGIKVLKLYAWEPSFMAQVMKSRNKEVSALKHTAYINAGASFIWTFAPFMVSLLTFATYVLIDENNILDANKAYVSILLFNILREPISSLPFNISSFIQAYVSLKRINKFINADEVDANNVLHEPNEDYRLIIDNGTFSWGEDAILKNINIHLKSSTLTAVVGTVGAGKSSLISAFLGEMEKTSGTVNTHGNIAYVSQQAWIQNATLRDNILFGKPLNLDFYNKVIEACALEPDLEILPGGDQTEIGEKGINLSGGQKQRVSLARAVYADADIYFLDDPLSAVDSHVGKHIFQHIIGPKGLLKNKTRLLVTHGIIYLPQTDQILVIKNGEVTENGTYKELLDRKEALAELVLMHIKDDSLDVDELTELKDQLLDPSLADEIKEKLSHIQSLPHSSGQTDDVIVSYRNSTSSDTLKPLKHEDVITSADNSKKLDKLITAEKAETGRVGWQVYKFYLKSMGYFFILMALLLNLICEAFNVGSNAWLGVWADDKNIAVNSTVNTGKRDMYVAVYGAFGLGFGISAVFRNIAISLGCLTAAQVLHRKLLDGVLHSPMAFFDTSPTGRILSRFSKDVDVLDEPLRRAFADGAWCLFEVLGTLVVISVATPLFMTVVIPIGLIYYFILKVYIATSRQLKRLESISRSPIYSHFGETVAGSQSIRAFGQEERFIMESEEKVDQYQACFFPRIMTNRWLSIRLEMIGNLVIFFAALFSVLASDQAPALVGLSITYAIQVTLYLNYLIMMTSTIETDIVAAERIKEYTELPQEAAWNIMFENVSKSWPESGIVEFNDYAVRYRPDLDLVLKNVNFQIKSGEKVGVVGRTGAGKSSLTLSLFRIIEASKGRILIDGVNIADLGLQTLRSRLTIIPQDPVLFSGTLRMNLDPYNSYSDEEIWNSLEHAHIKEFILGLPAGLQHQVSEGGENLSVGQRQLICLSRALLRKTKLLILDEATAAIDLETDDLIQKTIRTEFKDCTVLTIAHRLNTIMDSDRIIVIDKGKIVEYDTSDNLLANSNSVFAKMHKDAGLS